MIHGIQRGREDGLGRAIACATARARRPVRAAPAGATGLRDGSCVLPLRTDAPWYGGAVSDSASEQARCRPTTAPESFRFPPVPCPAMRVARAGRHSRRSGDDSGRRRFARRRSSRSGTSSSSSSAGQIGGARARDDRVRDLGRRARRGRCTHAGLRLRGPVPRLRRPDLVVLPLPGHRLTAPGPRVLRAHPGLVGRCRSGRSARSPSGLLVLPLRELIDENQGVVDDLLDRPGPSSPSSRSPPGCWRRSSRSCCSAACCCGPCCPRMRGRTGRSWSAPSRSVRSTSSAGARSARWRCCPRSIGIGVDLGRPGGAQRRALAVDPAAHGLQPARRARCRAELTLVHFRNPEHRLQSRAPNADIPAANNLFSGGMEWRLAQDVRKPRQSRSGCGSADATSCSTAARNVRRTHGRTGRRPEPRPGARTRPRRPLTRLAAPHQPVLSAPHQWGEAGRGTATGML